MKGLKSGSIDISDFNYMELVRRVEGDGVCMIHTMKAKK
jgi:hypothetical protein